MELPLIQLSHPSTLIRSSLFNIKPFSTPKHFHLHAQRLKCQIQGMSTNGQYSTKKVLVHGVKDESETLTSISKLYDCGVTICENAAANKGVVDVDLSWEGQMLTIPSVIPLSLKMQKGEPTGSSKSSLSGKGQSVGSCSRCLNEKIFTVRSFPRNSYAKTTGYFLVLVPLIAFCIRFVMGALQNRVAGGLKCNVNESEDRHPVSKRTRWKSALQELSDPDAMDTELSTDHDHLSGDEGEFKHQDLSHNYTKLERDYEKFLLECGISSCGYWRGGSPK